MSIQDYINFKVYTSKPISEELNLTFKLYITDKLYYGIGIQGSDLKGKFITIWLRTEDPNWNYKTIIQDKKGLRSYLYKQDMKIGDILKDLKIAKDQVKLLLV